MWFAARPSSRPRTLSPGTVKAIFTPARASHFGQSRADRDGGALVLQSSTLPLSFGVTVAAPAVVAGRVSPVVRELQWHRFIELLQPADHHLKVVLVLAGDAQGVALDLGLHLGELVADQLAQLLGQDSSRPRRRVIFWRTLSPPAGSILPQSKILSDRPRRRLCSRSDP
jgi:hypothetical protein